MNWCQVLCTLFSCLFPLNCRSLQAAAFVSGRTGEAALTLTRRTSSSTPRLLLAQHPDSRNAAFLLSTTTSGTICSRRTSRDLANSNRLDETLPRVSSNIVGDTESLSGVRYESVMKGLEKLYPSQDLKMRNAASRTDGYWAFISKGLEPPMDLTYGEFEFQFFAQLLDRAHFHFFKDRKEKRPSWDGRVFADLGSGTGRLVLGAAALHPGWKMCRGIELLEGIHKVALEKLALCSTREEATLGGGAEFLAQLSSPRRATLSFSPAGAPHLTSSLELAPIDLRCGSFDDPNEVLGDVDCAFVFSSCFSADLMERLGRAVGRQFQPGSIIITTEYMLPLENTIPPIDGEDNNSGHYKLELVEEIDGSCWLTGGTSTAYIHKVVESMARQN